RGALRAVRRCVRLADARGRPDRGRAAAGISIRVAGNRGRALSERLPPLPPHAAGDGARAILAAGADRERRAAFAVACGRATTRDTLTPGLRTTLQWHASRWRLSTSYGSSGRTWPLLKASGSTAA